ncbi:MAG: DUF3798 domain-containing protein, partial [Deltaproteobacteria bacterium]|nr:DUF3798 domain-containing protein [Deltaproteobacteria bacterium]
YFPEADEPSPLLGYPEALGLDPDSLQGDWPEIAARVEEAVREAGGAGRLGAWTASLAGGHVAALTRHAVRAVSGEVAAADIRALLGSYEAAAPGVHWNGQPLTDPAGREYPNMLLVYQDTYIFGRGHVGTTSRKVPSKYAFAGGGAGPSTAPGAGPGADSGGPSRSGGSPWAADGMIRRGDAAGGPLRDITPAYLYARASWPGSAGSAGAGAAAGRPPAAAD